MDKYNKDNVKMGIEVLLLFLLGTLAIATSFGCFNYATLAREAGSPDNVFWFIGVANIAYNAFVIVREAKKLGKKYATDYSNRKNMEA